MKKILMSNKKIQDFEFALLSLDLVLVHYFLIILYFFLFGLVMNFHMYQKYVIHFFIYFDLTGGCNEDIAMSLRDFEPQVLNTVETVIDNGKLKLD